MVEPVRVMGSERIHGLNIEDLYGQSLSKTTCKWMVNRISKLESASKVDTRRISLFNSVGSVRQCLYSCVKAHAFEIRLVTVFQ
jgi:hypothetical protein